jgi:hypothetical protein
MMHLRRTAIASVVISLSSAAAAQQQVVGAELNRFLDRWSSGPINSSDVHELYAPFAQYYGRKLSQDQVTREKQSIARKWPNRRYSIVPNSIDHRCTRDRSRCTVTGVLRWTVANSAGRGSSGASTLTLSLRRAGPGYQIVSESGSVISRGGQVR